jgi:UDP-N-acetylglucosamine 2-epimerase (non-hydrolysing)
VALDIVMIAGARPNFMKIAPVVRALAADGRLTGTLVHTGQHYDRALSELFFEQLGIPEPAIRLGVGSGSHAVQTAEVMTRLEPVLVERSPAAVLVVGDVNSTLAASLVAAKLGIPIAHVEAGLRSFDRSMPEEINRLVTDALSTWLFVSERSGLHHLEREGIPPERVHFVGNVMIDTMLHYRATAQEAHTARSLGLEPRAYAVLTLHRPSNVDDPAVLEGMLAPIVELGSSLPVVFPVHPRTRRVLEGLSLPRDGALRVIEPLGYLEFLSLMMEARLVLTDSGGIQEETTVLGVPCVTLRENTERPVTVSEGTNRLAGLTPAGIRGAIADALASDAAGRIPELWDGRAAERIVDRLARDLIGRQRLAVPRSHA